MTKIYDCIQAAASIFEENGYAVPEFVLPEKEWKEFIVPIVAQLEDHSAILVHKPADKEVLSCVWNGIHVRSKVQR